MTAEGTAEKPKTNRGAKPGRSNVRSSTRSRIVMRRVEVARLLAEGMTTRQIAEELKIGQGTAHGDIVALRASLPVIAAEEWRKTDLERVEFLWEKNLPMVRRHNQGAIKTALSILERRARILGYEAPKRIEAMVHEVTQEDLEVAELIREARAKADVDKAKALGLVTHDGDGNG